MTYRDVRCFKEKILEFGLIIGSEISTGTFMNNELMTSNLTIRFILSLQIRNSTSFKRKYLK